MPRMTRLFPTLCCLFMALLLHCIVPCRTLALESYNVGFRTLGYWGGMKGLRLDINVWYPTIRREKEFQYTPWTLYGARNGKAVEGRFPLVLVSHATPGTRFSYHDTCYALAARGFVVAALTHPNDCMNNMDNIFTWRQLTARTQELSGAIGVLEEDREMTASIDWNRIGVLGFGAGGAAALLLGGALPNCDAWAGYCGDVPRGDIYCNSWTYEKMQAICASFPLKKSLADTRIKAVAIAQPGYAMLFGGDALRYFYPPLLVLASNRDTIQLRKQDAEAIARAMPGKAQFTRLKGADMGALMAACPETFAAELPELCRSVSRTERAAIHGAMQDALGEFFLKHLGNSDNLPQIPEPPDLTPAVNKAAPAQETGKGKATQRRRARQSGKERQ